MENLQNKLNWLLAQPNALRYSLSALKKSYNWENVLLQQKSVRRAEAWCIASSLCGYSGLKLAMRFMEGGDCVEDFLYNVSFNGAASNPLILRAIHLRLAKLVPVKKIKSIREILSDFNLIYSDGINWATVKVYSKEQAEKLITAFNESNIRCRKSGNDVQFHW